MAPEEMMNSKSYLDYVLDYFLVLTAIISVFSSCLCTLYSVYSGRLNHILRFVALNMVLCLTITNISVIPRMLLTYDSVKCEVLPTSRFLSKFTKFKKN